MKWQLIISPISSAKGEIAGTLYRARHLIKIARDALKPIPQTDNDTEAVKKVIVKQPIGVVGYVFLSHVLLPCRTRTLLIGG